MIMMMTMTMMTMSMIITITITAKTIWTMTRMMYVTPHLQVLQPEESSPTLA